MPCNGGGVSKKKVGKTDGFGEGTSAPRASRKRSTNILLVGPEEERLKKSKTREVRGEKFLNAYRDHWGGATFPKRGQEKVKGSLART